MAPPGLEDRSSERGQEGEVDEQPDRPELGGDGERSGVRDVLALALPCVLLLPAHERLRADSDADHRMRGVDRPCHLDERAAGRSSPGCAESPPPSARRRCPRRGRARPTRRRRRGASSLSPASSSDHEHGAEERDEACLRVGEVEADRQADPERGRPTAGRTSASQRDREEHDDAEDEVAAVDTRILEDRRHAEERRVRVGELDVLLGEDFRVRPGLVDADRGEDRGHGHEARRERTPRPVSRSGEGDDREENR